MFNVSLFKKTSFLYTIYFLQLFTRQNNSIYIIEYEMNRSLLICKNYCKQISAGNVVIISIQTFNIPV